MCQLQHVSNKQPLWTSCFFRNNISHKWTQIRQKININIFKQFSVLIWNKNQNWEQALIYTGEETKSCKMWERSVSPPFYLRYRYFSRFHLKLFRYNPLFSVWRLLAILRFPLHPTLNFWEKVREAEMTGWKVDDNAWSFSSKSSQSISCIFPLTLRNGSPSKLRATKAVYTKAVLFGL